MTSSLDNAKFARVIAYLIGRGLLEEAGILLNSRELKSLSSEIQKDIISDMVLESDEDRAREVGVRRKKELDALNLQKDKLRTLEKLIETGNINEAKTSFRQFLATNGVNSATKLPQQLRSLVPKQLLPKARSYCVQSASKEITEALKKSEDQETLLHNLPQMSSWRDISER